MPEFNRIKASVRFNTVYTCTACGRRQLGDTRTVEVDASSVDGVAATLNSVQQTAHAMPIEWSNGDQGFRCGPCTKGT